MWFTTTRSMVKEIKRNQEELIAKLEDVTFNHKESQLGICNQINDLKYRIAGIESAMAESKTEQNVKSSELMMEIAELADSVKQMRNYLVIAYKNNTEQIEDTINRVSDDMLEEISGRLDASVERINNLTECVFAQKEENLSASVSHMLDSDRRIASKLSEIKSQNVELERMIHGAVDGIEHSIQEKNNESMKEIQRVNDGIVALSLASEERSEAFAENLTSVNTAMQEIVRNILSLDEGNRLIIARFLLNDMEG